MRRARAARASILADSDRIVHGDLHSCVAQSELLLSPPARQAQNVAGDPGSMPRLHGVEDLKEGGVTSARGLGDNLGFQRAPCREGIWRIPLVWRRWLVLGGAVAMTVLVLGVFAPGFFVGPADWMIGLGGALLLLLCLFGHFSWLLLRIGFAEIGRASCRERV